jgi:hypothetical protein
MIAELLLLASASDPGRVVGLVTGESPPHAESLALWRIGLVLAGLASAAAAAGIAAWRVRTSPAEAHERAFRALARRQRIGAGARELLRRAAAAHGCHPVALLASRSVLEAALASLHAADLGAAAPAAFSLFNLAAAGSPPATAASRRAGAAPGRPGSPGRGAS